MPGAATARFGGHEHAEFAGGREGGQVGGGKRVTDRLAVVIAGGLGERSAQLDLAGAGPAVLAFAVPASVSAATTGTPVPSIAM